MLMLKAALPKAGRLYLSDDAGKVLVCFALVGNKVTLIDHEGKELATVVIPFLH